jgi:hypothetical protein
MPNEVTITISCDSSTGGRSVIAGSADTSSSPLSIDALGAPAETSGLGDAQSSSKAQTPLPLDQLRLHSSHDDSAALAPSPLEPPSSAGDDVAPSPLPLDELQPDGMGREGPPVP